MAQDIQVGKYTLESLTTGMYSDPKIVYREYIQNSVDALEDAVEMKLINRESMRIDIIVNAEDSYVEILDNGTGIASVSAASTLMNIGTSKKRQSNNRGFRGIGRLGGMSYCGRLVFTTSAIDEPVKTIVSFDCDKLKQLLVPDANEDMDLATLLADVTTIEQDEELETNHYFKVEMFDVSGFSDLLNMESVKNYISQVAPLPYKTKTFVYSTELHQFLAENGYELEEFPVFLGKNTNDFKLLHKPNKSRFYADRNKKKHDDIISMEYFKVEIDGELYALGWYGISNWLGSIADLELAGIRVRKGNILIGDNRTLNPIFKEARFNGWTQGELFIVTDKLIPNARRDDFEQNDAYYKLIDFLRNGIGEDISKLIREASIHRNDPSAKSLNEIQKKVNEAKVAVSEGFNSSVDKEHLLNDLSDAEKKLQGTKVKDNLQAQKKSLQSQLSEVIQEVSTSNNYKINQVKSGIDRKSKKILAIVTDVLSEKLSKELVNEIIKEIISALNRG